MVNEQVVPTARSHLQRWAEVVNHSDRSVTLIDLCGHEKYLKTTVFGLTGKRLIRSAMIFAWFCDSWADSIFVVVQTVSLLYEKKASAYGIILTTQEFFDGNPFRSAPVPLKQRSKQTSSRSAQPADVRASKHWLVLVVSPGLTHARRWRRTLSGRFDARLLPAGGRREYGRAADDEGAHQHRVCAPGASCACDRNGSSSSWDKRRVACMVQFSGT